MRQLSALLGGFGLMMGLGCALLVHDLPAGIIGRRFAWGGYIPLDVQIESFPVHVSFTWLPSLLVLPGLGLALGLVAGVVVARLGWQLTRPAA